MTWRIALTFCFMMLMGFSATHAFYDITETDPQRETFNHLRDVGIMHGYGDGNFHPNNYISRAEAVTIALRAGGYRLGEFSGRSYFDDIDPNAWHAPIVSRAVEVSLISKNHYRNFRPDEAVSKAEFLALLFRATKAPIHLHKTERDIANDIPNSAWLTPIFAYAKRFQIAHLPTDNLYRPEKSLNRREVAMMTYRQLRLLHGSASTAQFIELQATVQQFLALINEGKYKEAEFHLHDLMRKSDDLIRTENNEDSVGARAMAQAMQHLGDSFRYFRYGKNIKAISSLHLSLKQAKRAEEKSNAMAPFARDLSQLIHGTIVSLTQPSFVQAD